MYYLIKGYIANSNWRVFIGYSNKLSKYYLRLFIFMSYCNYVLSIITFWYFTKNFPTFTIIGVFN